MHSVAQRLLSHVRRDELLNAGDRVGVAVSGGIDSVALLRLLLELRFELGIVLSVVHFNHKLRGAESDADEEFVRNLARQHDLEFYVDRGEVAAHARERGVSIEAAARELRYEFFCLLIRNQNIPQEVKVPSLSQNAREGGNPSSQAPQGLKPNSQQPLERGAEAPLFHDLPVDSSQEHSGAAGSRALSNRVSTRPETARAGAGTKLGKIATGHTLDDQAETVLMRIIRGAGSRGLAAIYPRIEVDDDDGQHCGEIVRPLLEIRRCELEGYLKDIDQRWREDSTNADHHFTRNRVRKLLVPLLEKEFNPKIAEGLGELAEIARDEEDYWENEVAGWMGTVVHWGEPGSESQTPHPVAENARGMGQPELIQIQPAASHDSPASRQTNASVDRLWFLGQPIAVQRRLIKGIARQAGIPLEFKHIDEIVRFASENGPSGKELALPVEWKLLRESAELVFVAPDLSRRGTSKDYEYSLAVPGRVVVSEIGSEFEARIIEHAGESATKLDGFLSPEIAHGGLTIRNWRAGDRFWPAHTKSAKKIKELLTELHVNHTARVNWPVVASGHEIVWVRGLPASAKYRVKAGQPALSIQESPISGGESI